MLLKNLTKVWISEYETVNDHGEKIKKWKYKGKVLTVGEVNKLTVKQFHEMLVKKLRDNNDIDGIAWLNLQQDVNELDRKPTGEIDYSIENARTNKKYNIQKGNGISLTDISRVADFVPEYVVTDNPKVGKTTLYKLEKYNGN